MLFITLLRGISAFAQDTKEEEKRKHFNNKMDNIINAHDSTKTVSAPLIFKGSKGENTGIANKERWFY